MAKGLLILSGGQDSTLCGFWAKRVFEEVHAITINYGQKHQREIDSAAIIGNLLEVESHEFIDVGKILTGTSPLVSDTELPQYQSYSEMPDTGVEPTFVPGRNILFMTIAANRAYSLGINNIITGVCEADNAGYGDCRDAFVRAQEEAFRIALASGRDNAKLDFNIHTPLMFLTKAESIKLAMSLPGAYIAWAFSHTSYNGEYPPIDKNHANVLRAKGFEEAGVPDPLIVRAYLENEMELPDTSNYDVVRNNLIQDFQTLEALVGATKN